MYSFVDEYVSRFQVSVDDAIFDEMEKTIEDVGEEFERLLFWEYFLFGNHFVEIATIAEFLDDVVVIGCFHNIVEADDIG
jgi:hypothetical protein